MADQDKFKKELPFGITFESDKPVDVSTVEGQLPFGTARVDLAPTFLKEGREGLAGLLTFLLGQAALPEGQRAGAFPPELLASLFSSITGPTGGTPTNGDGAGGFTGGGTGDEGDGGEENVVSVSREAVPDLPTLPTVPGLPGFMEGVGRGPNAAGAVVAGIGGGLTIANQLKNLLGGSDQPAEIVGGGPSITPIFPDINQQQLQLFLQLLQSMNTGGPAAALGPNPLTADATGGGIAGLLPPPIDLAEPVVPEVGTLPVTPSPPPIEDSGLPGTQPVIPEPIPTEPPLAGGNGEVSDAQPNPLQAFLDQIQSGNPLQDLAQFFSLPTFEGPFTTPATDLQRQSLGASSEFLGTSLPERNQTAQDSLQELIRTGGEGAPGVDPLSALTRETSAEPTLEEFLTTGGGRFDLSPQFSALEAINKRRLEEQLAVQKEQFGVLGARFGTDIAKGRGELEARALESGAGQRAEIAGQSFREQQQRRLESLGLASGRDIAREQIGLAGRGQDLQMQDLIQRVFGAGQERRLGALRLGEEGRRTDIAGREQRGREIEGGFRLGEAERQIGDTAVQRQIAEFARTQGALFPLLMQFLSQGVGPEEIVLPPE